MRVGVNNGETVIVDPATVDVYGQELLVAKWVIITVPAAKPCCFLGTIGTAACY